MRFREDFYTLCPECDARISLTLAARLQATRLGSSCQCKCGHDWICISEWVYRDEPVAPPAAPQVVSGPVSPGAPPRPHLLPTFQPPAHAAPPQAAQAHSQPEPASDGAGSVPLPHAFPTVGQPAAPRPADPFPR